ncbi:RNA polymerase sigma factor WhiG [Clostridia bacterium]|nr:RNA polymerase sigma factor WhiG [Clostridia bacterium]GHU74422.1 RNA polymerase sigma factor WhiG [Clostridia bacterium]
MPEEVIYTESAQLIDKGEGERLWAEYSRTKNPDLKEKIIVTYVPLVKFVAGRLHIHLGSHVEYDDLVGYGVFGLLDAVDKFDNDKGVKFETYASLRVRGAIIDNIRRMDWVPRSLRQKSKQLEQTFQELEAMLGREPSEDEISWKLGVPVEEVRDIIKNSSVLSLISLDDYLETSHEEPNMRDETQTARPETSYEKKEVARILKDAIDNLKENEKKVINLYYYEELTLKEISYILGVSESRVSQIHTKAVMKLGTKLGTHRYVLFS